MNSLEGYNTTGHEYRMSQIDRSNSKRLKWMMNETRDIVKKRDEIKKENNKTILGDKNITPTLHGNSNSSSNYEIYIIRNQVNNEIDTRYIKVYLTDSNEKPLGIYRKSFSPSYYSLKYLDKKPEAKSIYKGKIKANSKKDFIFRAWVSDGYSFHSNENSFSFSIGVRQI